MDLRISFFFFFFRNLRKIWLMTGLSSFAGYTHSFSGYTLGYISFFMSKPCSSSMIKCFHYFHAMASTQGSKISRFSGDSCVALAEYTLNPRNSNLSSFMPCSEQLSANAMLHDIRAGIRNTIDQVAKFKDPRQIIGSDIIKSRALHFMDYSHIYILINCSFCHMCALLPQK